MINLLCNLVAKIVFSGVNGTILIPLLVFLLYISVGQVKEFIEINKQVFKGEV